MMLIKKTLAQYLFNKLRSGPIYFTFKMMAVCKHDRNFESRIRRRDVFKMFSNDWSVYDIIHGFS